VAVRGCGLKGVWPQGVLKISKNVLIPKKQKCMGDVGEVSEKAGK